MSKKSSVDDPLRGTGRTTAGVLDALSRALLHPGQEQMFRDHDGMTAVRALRLKHQVLRAAAALGIRHLTVSVNTCNDVVVTSTVLMERKAR